MHVFVQQLQIHSFILNETEERKLNKVTAYLLYLKRK